MYRELKKRGQYTHTHTHTHTPKMNGVRTRASVDYRQQEDCIVGDEAGAVDMTRDIRERGHNLFFLAPSHKSLYLLLELVRILTPESLSL